MVKNNFNCIVDFDKEYDSKEQLFDVLSSKLVSEGFVEDNYNKEILKREKVYPTGLKTKYCNVAIPHTNSEFVKQPFIYFTRLKDKLNFCEMSGVEETLEVKMVFVLGIKEAKNQVVILQSIMNFLMDAQKVKDCLNSNDKKRVEKIIEEILEGVNE